MKISKKWKRISEIYKRFAVDYPLADFSEAAELEMFSHESTGTPVESNNGYLLGKRTMDITVAMWKEDIRNGCLIKSELLKDYPEWFLETIGVLNIQPSFDNCKWWLYK